MRRESIARVLCGLLIGMVLSATQSGTSTGAFGGSFTTSLTISDTAALILPPDSVTISWGTSDNASSQVFYDTLAHGDTGDYASYSVIDSTRVLQHAVTLGGLNSSTVYHFRTMSTANVGGTLFTAISEDLAFITNLSAETGIAQGLSGNATDVVVVKANINRMKAPSDNSTATIPGGIGSYSATVSGSPGNAIQFLTAYGALPLNGLTFDNTTGALSGAVASPIQASNTTLAELAPILTGNTTTSVSLTITFHGIRAAGQSGLTVPEEHSNTITLKRGDANGSGGISIADSLVIKQYLVSQLTLAQISPLNAASVSHDGAGGDKITIADALDIEQFLVGQKSAYFQ